MQINSDTTLRHKIERINLLLTNRIINKSNLNELLLKSNTDMTSLGEDASDAMPFSQLDSDSIKSGGETATELVASQSKVDYFLIEMFLIDLRKYIAASVQLWNMRMSEFFKKSKFDDVSWLFHQNKYSTRISIFFYLIIRIQYWVIIKRAMPQFKHRRPLRYPNISRIITLIKKTNVPYWVRILLGNKINFLNLKSLGNIFVLFCL